MSTLSAPKFVQDPPPETFGRRWSHWAPLMFIIAFQVFVSEQSLSHSQAFESSVVFLSSIFDAVERWSSRSAFPNTTRFVFTFCGYVSIFYAYLCWKDEGARVKFLGGEGFVSRYLRRPCAVMVGFLPSVGLFLVAFPEENNCTSRCAYNSRVFLTVVPFGISLMAGWGMAATLWLAQSLFPNSLIGRSGRPDV